jgi:hypothetical protein
LVVAGRKSGGANAGPRGMPPKRLTSRAALVLLDERSGRFDGPILPFIS